MARKDSLFGEFPPAGKADWIAALERELKGGALSDLDHGLRDGIVLHPVYTAEDRKGKRTGIPQRGQKHRDLVEAIEVVDAKTGNAEALDVLNRGASALLLYINRGVDLSLLLKDVRIEHIVVHLVSDGEADRMHAELTDIVQERGLKPEQLRGSINADPIENLARTGNWFRNEPGDFEILKALLNGPFTGMRMLCVNGGLYHNAGATPAEELGIALAHAHEFLVHFGVEHAPRFQFNLAIGREYLTEIAKFRAMRLLWQKLLSTYNTAETPLQLFAENGMRNKTNLDANTNMLRTTTEAMSALIGGADELRVAAYDEYFGEASPLGRRIARNQMLVMQYEAFLARVEDPAAGAYAIEELTDNLAERAWDVFREIESAGGLIKGLMNGSIQDRITQSAAGEQAEYDAGHIQLVGANVYRNGHEKAADTQATEPGPKKQPATTVRPVRAGRLAESTERGPMKKPRA